jgi:hypothetical protein
VSTYVRTVKPAPGAPAVQIVYSSRRGTRDIEHIGSAHDDAGLEVLKAAARQRLAAGQGELDLGLAGTGDSRSGGGWHTDDFPGRAESLHTAAPHWRPGEGRERTWQAA